MVKTYFQIIFKKREKTLLKIKNEDNKGYCFKKSTINIYKKMFKENCCENLNENNICLYYNSTNFKKFKNIFHHFPLIKKNFVCVIPKDIKFRKRCNLNNLFCNNNEFCLFSKNNNLILFSISIKHKKDLIFLGFFFNNKKTKVE
jgi:hypothetical protein